MLLVVDVGNTQTHFGLFRDGETTCVIATGGLASVLVPFIRETIDVVDDLLTLTGLRLIWERNSLELREA